MPNICGRSAARLRWGRARLPNPASATVDAEWAKRARRVRLFLARIAIAIRATSSNHDEGCPLNLTPGLRFYDRGMTLRRGKIVIARSKATKQSIADVNGHGSLRSPLAYPIASSCRCRRTGTARPERGYRRPGHRADCDVVPASLSPGHAFSPHAQLWSSAP